MSGKLEEGGCYPEYRGEFRIPEYGQSVEEKADRRSRRGKRAGGNFRINKRLVEAESAETVLEIVEKELRNFNFVNISTCMYRLALVSQPLTPMHRDHIRQDPRLRGLLREVADTLELDADEETEEAAVLSPKEVSNLVWAATKLGVADGGFFSAVGKTAVRYMDEYDSVNVSLTLWGFAKMDQENRSLFRAARSRVLSLLPSFEPHRLCNTVWAYAKMDREDGDDEGFFRALAEEAYRKSSKFNTSNESMLLYSLALAHCYYKPLYDRFLSRLERSIVTEELADPRSLSNLVWSLVEVNKVTNHISIVNAVIASANANINRYSLTHLATLLGSLLRSGSFAPSAASESASSQPLDLLFAKAYEQTKVKYSPNVPFEQAVSTSDLETLRDAFTRHCNFPDIFPVRAPAPAAVEGEKAEDERPAASAAVEVVKQAVGSKELVMYDVLGTVVIGLVLMGVLEFFRAYANA